MSFNSYLKDGYDDICDYKTYKYYRRQLLKQRVKSIMNTLDINVICVSNCDNLISEIKNMEVKPCIIILDLNLENEINEILKELSVKVLEKNIKLDFKTMKNINLKINKNYFYIMFSNLVINAIKYNIDF